MKASAKRAGRPMCYMSGRAAQEFTNLPAGALYEIEEGTGVARSTKFAARNSPSPESPAILTENAAALFADTWLIEPVPLPEQASPGYLHLSDRTPDTR